MKIDRDIGSEKFSRQRCQRFDIARSIERSCHAHEWMQCSWNGEHATMRRKTASDRAIGRDACEKISETEWPQHHEERSIQAVASICAPMLCRPR